MPTYTTAGRGINTYAATPGTDNYATPRDFYALLDSKWHFDAFDPCPVNPTGLREFDGSHQWPPGLKAVFLNPPYSDVTPWLNRSIEASERGATVVVLLKGDTSTVWFHELVWPFVLRGEALFQPVKGRLCFDGGKITTNGKKRPGAPFNSILVAYRLSEPPVANPLGGILP